MGCTVSDRCPTCDREACPWWLARRGITCPVACGYLMCIHVGSIAQNSADDCARHAVDWRAEALALRAAKARLTVGAALALPEVQNGACVVECYDPRGDLTWQYGRPAVDDEDETVTRFYNVDEWTEWDHRGWLMHRIAHLPARLVHLADADLPPATRGEMP